MKSLADANATFQKHEGQYNIFERMPTKREGREPKCWTCQQGDYAAAQCVQEDSTVMGERLDLNTPIFVQDLRAPPRRVQEGRCSLQEGL